jgi:site-specific DNA recombinase
MSYSTSEPIGESPLAAWASRQGKVRPRRFRLKDIGLRFAFYGRISTADHQDRTSSRWWQRTEAEDLIEGHGRIVAEYFDVGVSRRVAWPDRPEAARLLTDLGAADSGFDAIVLGEFERAFQGKQLEELTSVLQRYGVALWLPETYGPVGFGDARQLALLDLLGVRSRREVSRARHRVMLAMRAQVEVQGRHLGGRPPYGYRLADAGPHPNKADADWGRRRHCWSSGAGA